MILKLLYYEHQYWSSRIFKYVITSSSSSSSSSFFFCKAYIFFHWDKSSPSPALRKLYCGFDRVPFKAFHSSKVSSLRSSSTLAGASPSSPSTPFCPSGVSLIKRLIINRWYKKNVEHGKLCQTYVFLCYVWNSKYITDSLYFDQFRKVQDWVSMVVFITEIYLCPPEILPHDRR